MIVINLLKTNSMMYKRIEFLPLRCGSKPPPGRNCANTEETRPDPPEVAVSADASQSENTRQCCFICGFNMLLLACYRHLCKKCTRICQINLQMKELKKNFGVGPSLGERGSLYA